MNSKIHWQLTEAIRRLNMSELRGDTGPILKRFLGLGTAAQYKESLDAGLMVFYDGQKPPKRCSGWLCLTEKGIVLALRHAKLSFQIKTEPFVSQVSRLKLF